MTLMTSYRRKNWHGSLAAPAAVLLTCLLGFGATLLPTGSYAQMGARPAQIASVQVQVQQSLASIERQAFPTDLAKQIAKAKALVIVTGTVLSAKTVTPADAISGMVTTSLGAGVPAPIAVATIVSAAFRNGVAPEAAIAAATIAAIAARADGGDVTAAAIVAAMEAKVPAASIGEGLGRAATSLSRGNPVAAATIAQGVADEGTATIVIAFSNSVADAVGSAQLMAIANGPPRAAASNNHNNNPGNPILGVPGFIQSLLTLTFTSIGLPPPCFTPSCS